MSVGYGDDLAEFNINRHEPLEAVFTDFTDGEHCSGRNLYVRDRPTCDRPAAGLLNCACCFGACGFAANGNPEICTS